MTYSYYIKDADVAKKFNALLQGVNKMDWDEGVMFMLDSTENKYVSVEAFKKEYSQFIEKV